MKTPTPEQIKEAIEHLRKSTRAQLCFECKPALDTLIAALKAEQERLDWLLSNMWHISNDGEYWNGNINRWVAITDRSAIDSLRNQTQP